ncbi:hypothetical protein [Halobaculum sp. EA56]|uniref:hypothetical protein n=1 Tax=Halobaculum sp. EA56 TaxID=3421648 RepID=UPI003EBB9FEA
MRFGERQRVASLALFSLGTELVTVLHIIADVASLCLLFYAMYVVTHWVIEVLDSELATNRGLRVVLAGLSVGFGLAFPLGQPWPIVTLFLLGTLLVDQFLLKSSIIEHPRETSIRTDVLFGLNSRSEAIHEWALLEQRLKSVDSQVDRWVAMVTRRTLPTLTLVAPCFLLGGLAVILSFIFPVLEVLLLGGALLGPVLVRNVSTYDSQGELLRFLDIEERTSEVLLHPDLRNVPGFALIGVILLNISFPALLFFSSLVLVPQIVGTYRSRIVISGLIDGVIITGLAATVALTFITFSLYGLWYWLRMFRRLPATVRWLRTVSSQSIDTNTKIDEPAVGRPPVGMIPAGLLLCTFVFIVRATPETKDAAEVWLLGYFGLWLAGIITLGHGLYRCRIDSPLSAATDVRSLAIDTLAGWGAVAIVMMTVPDGPRAVSIVLAMAVISIGGAFSLLVCGFAVARQGVNARTPVAMGAVLVIGLVLIDRFVPEYENAEFWIFVVITVGILGFAGIRVLSRSEVSENSTADADSLTDSDDRSVRADDMCRRNNK